MCAWCSKNVLNFFILCSQGHDDSLAEKKDDTEPCCICKQHNCEKLVKCDGCDRNCHLVCMGTTDPAICERFGGPLCQDCADELSDSETDSHNGCSDTDPEDEQVNDLLLVVKNKLKKDDYQFFQFLFPHQRSRRSNEPCYVCRQDNCEEMIKCYVCGQYCHPVCLGMTDEDCDKLSRWACKHCVLDGYKPVLCEVSWY